MAKLDVFDSTLQKTYEWLQEIGMLLGWEQEQRSYLALRAVLQTLRDRLPMVEAAHLGAQLPMLIRGLYYDGWKPGLSPLKLKRDEFLACIQDQFRNDPTIDPAQVTRAVLGVMMTHVDPGQISKIAAVLPHDFADLWHLSVGI